jgi:putative NIF3 family GTP cyclohydrolase 1 type 2
MNDLLAARLGLTVLGPLAFDEGKPMGYICKPEGDISARSLALRCKEALGCKAVRYTDCANAISRVAVCSGSGGSFLSEVLAKGCDGYITGDVKHDIFIDAYNAGLTVFDAGHFYTEDIFCGYILDMLNNNFPQAETAIAESSRDVVEWYIGG